MPLLEAVKLTKTYGTRKVVDSASFYVDGGEIVGLLGPNGAGKTTCFQMVLGLVVPDSGEVIFNEHPVSRLPMYKRARLGIGYLAQQPSIFQRLTVRENVLAILEFTNMPKKERSKTVTELLERFDMLSLANNLAYTLSGGERRRLEILRALITRPKTMLLDEPFSGVDPKSVTQIQNIIRDLVRSGIGILLTDHNVRDTLRVTNRAYIIDEGRIMVHGKPEEIVENDYARRHYLGDDFTL